jgi:hypothetical protein
MAFLLFFRLRSSLVDRITMPSGRRSGKRVARLAPIAPAARLDPSNAGWQRDLRISLRNVVDTLRRLEKESTLTAEQAKWLAEAEAQGAMAEGR